MRSPFLKAVLVMFALVLVGVGITIACRAGTSLETMVPPAIAAPPPTPTELPPAEKEVAERAKQYLREHAAEYSLRPDLSDLEVSRVDISLGAGVLVSDNSTEVFPLTERASLYSFSMTQNSHTKSVVPTLPK